jgi:hypothetical protein
MGMGISWNTSMIDLYRCVQKKTSKITKHWRYNGQLSFPSMMLRWNGQDGQVIAHFPLWKTRGKIPSMVDTLFGKSQESSGNPLTPRKTESIWQMSVVRSVY